MSGLVISDLTEKSFTDSINNEKVCTCNVCYSSFCTFARATIETMVIWTTDSFVKLELIQPQCFPNSLLKTKLKTEPSLLHLSTIIPRILTHLYYYMSNTNISVLSELHITKNRPTNIYIPGKNI